MPPCSILQTTGWGRLVPLEVFQGVRTPATTSTDQEKSTVRNLWYNENLEGRCVFRHGPRRPLLDWALGKPNKIVPPPFCACGQLHPLDKVLKFSSIKEECNFFNCFAPLGCRFGQCSAMFLSFLVERHLFLFSILFLLILFLSFVMLCFLCT